jgi:hypothetical protein
MVLVTIEEAVATARIYLPEGRLIIWGIAMRGAACIEMLVLISVLSVVDSRCQESTGPPTAESVAAHLTGGEQREWVKTLWKIRLGKKVPQCESGEHWTFNHDGKGIKKICDNGMPRERQFTWAWVGVQGDRPVLNVDDTQYLVEIAQQKLDVEGAPPVLVTVLRTLRSRQSDPVVEITLRFQDR